MLIPLNKKKSAPFSVFSVKIAQCSCFNCPVVGGNYINVNTEFSSARKIQRVNKIDVQLRAGASLRSKESVEKVDISTEKGHKDLQHHLRNSA